MVEGGANIVEATWASSSNIMQLVSAFTCNNVCNQSPVVPRIATILKLLMKDL